MVKTTYAGTRATDDAKWASDMMVDDARGETVPPILRGRVYHHDGPTMSRLKAVHKAGSLPHPGEGYPPAHPHSVASRNRHPKQWTMKMAVKGNQFMCHNGTPSIGLRAPRPLMGIWPSFF